MARRGATGTPVDCNTTDDTSTMNGMAIEETGVAWTVVEGQTYVLAGNRSLMYATQ